jgi:S1-C subfamily serine protease
MVKELLKRFFKSRLGAWTVAAVAAVTLIQGKKISDRVDYARMQASVVLIQASDGQGSGVVVERTNEHGQARVFIWTANHVVENDNSVTIKKAIRSETRRVGEAVFTAKVIGREAKRDLALLWLDAPAGYFRAAEFAPLAPIEVGTPLTHVGNVLGSSFEDSVSNGILSRNGIRPEGWPWELTDQAALAAFYGSSGGPLFRTGDGDVAGLVVGGVVGSGFMNFVPVRIIENFANENVLHWAVRGDWCPGDGLLQGLATREIQIKSFSVN